MVNEIRAPRRLDSIDVHTDERGPVRTIRAACRGQGCRTGVHWSSPMTSLSARWVNR